MYLGNFSLRDRDLFRGLAYPDKKTTSDYNNKPERVANFRTGSFNMNFSEMNSDENSDEEIEVKRNERLNITTISIRRLLNSVKNNSNRLLVTKSRL